MKVELNPGYLMELEAVNVEAGRHSAIHPCGKNLFHRHCENLETTLLSQKKKRSLKNIGGQKKGKGNY